MVTVKDELIVSAGMANVRHFQVDAGKVQTEMSEMNKLAQLGRNDFLFLSFGLLAAGAMIKKLGGFLDKMTDSMKESTMAIEQQATVVSTLTGGMARDYGVVREEMIRLGIETEFTATQAGEAMERLAMAGFNVAQTVGSAEETLRLATVGMVEVSEAANLAAGVMRSFNLDMSDADEAAGNLGATVAELTFAITNSATTASELGEALKFVGAVSSDLNLQFEGVNAFLMSAANNMVRGGIAGRGLRISLIKLSKALGVTTEGTLGTQATIEKYGLQLVDTSGDLKEMSDIVEELGNKLGGLTSLEREAALASLFGARAVTAWAAALQTGAEQLREWEIEMQTASARTSVFDKLNRNSTRVLKQWAMELGEGETALNFLTEEMKFSTEQAKDINNVIGEGARILRTEGQPAFDKWAVSLKDIASTSEVVRERLETLHGSMILLQASVDTMWASIGQHLGPVMTKWNKLLKLAADTMSAIPGPLAVVLGLTIMLGGAFFSAFGQLLLLIGSLVMMMAALEQFTGKQLANIMSSKAMAVQWKNLRVAALSLTGAIIKGLVVAFLKLLVVIGPIVLIALVVEHVWKKAGSAAGILTAAVMGLAAAVFWYGRAKKAAIGKELISIGLKMKDAAASLWNAAATRILSGSILILTGQYKALFVAMLPVLGLLGLVVAGIAAVAIASKNTENEIVGAYKNSTVPDAFKSGAKHIRETLSGLETDITATVGQRKTGIVPTGAAGGRAKTIVISPQANVTFGDVSLGDKKSLEDFRLITKTVVEEAVRKSVRKIERDIAVTSGGQ